MRLIFNCLLYTLVLGDCAHQRVVGSSSSSRIYKRTPENHEWVSIIETISAAGQTIPCLVIFKGKNIQSSWFEAENIPNWRYTCSENGWTAHHISYRWLEEIFLPQTQPNITSDSRILLMDNHGSHIPIDFMWKCFQNNVHLIYMPPHSSHCVQPLDLAIFPRVKDSYKAEIEKLARFENSAPIKKIRFVKYYNHARKNGLDIQYIKAGWRGAGLVPFNPQKVLNSTQVLPPVEPVTTPSTLRKRRNSDYFRPHRIDVSLF